MYDKGFSFDTIVRELDAKGFKTKTGGTFCKNSISDILRNEKYIGVYIFNRAIHKVKGKRNNRKSKQADQVIRIPGGMPQIIDKELWDRVQAKIEKRRRDPGKRAHNKATSEYLPTGKIECGLCGFKMVGKNGGTWGNKTRYDYYICNNRERKHAFEFNIYLTGEKRVSNEMNAIDFIMMAGREKLKEAIKTVGKGCDKYCDR